MKLPIKAYDSTIQDATGKIIATVYDKAAQEEIVNAVNSDYELISTLKYIANTIYVGNPQAALNEVQIMAKSAILKIKSK